MVGRLSADPQQFVTQNGITQSRITIASNDSWNKNETYFFPCVAWQSTANFINTYLKKGDLVAIDGKLIRRSYIGKDGRNNYVMEIVVETIRPFSTKNSNSYEQPSSMDENFKSNENMNHSNNVKTEEKTQTSVQIDNSVTNNEFNDFQKPTLKDDPFSLNDNDTDNDVVDLDWLRDFSDN